MKNILALVLLASVSVTGAPIKLVLPTENHHLFTGEPERFYMYVERNFEGEASKPWQGGSFGFVRSPLRVDGRILMTRFHEGVDIAPIKRDKAGNPLDLVSSVSAGTVAHSNPISGRSNYGRYVVVEHEWEQSKVYSLYAHLAEIAVEVGDSVKAGSVLGRMGYTGAGLNRTRAHVHLELGLMMSRYYEGWHQQNLVSANYHGLFNGMNIAGVDVTAFFLAHRKNPDINFSEFVSSRPAQFKVAVPANGSMPEFLVRYPWMKRSGPSPCQSWEIAFAATGHAISFTPSNRKLEKAVVSHLRPSDIDQSFLTRGLIIGRGNTATLSSNGRSLVSLLMDDFR